MDARGLPVRFLVTEGTRAECTQTQPLMAGLSAQYPLADKAYDTNDVLNLATELEMAPVIPPKENRKKIRDYDRERYKLRHQVKNAFLHLKRWRGIATRYAKNLNSFVAATQIRCLMLCIETS